MAKYPKRRAIEFKIIEARHRYVDHASRVALVSVCGQEFAQNSESYDEVLRLRSLALISRRRQRQMAMLQTGWQMPPSFYPGVLLNCPPVGMFLPEDNRGWVYCRRTLVCPFCWCREYVYRTFNSLDHVLFRGNEVRPLQTLLVVRKFTVPQQQDLSCLDAAHELIRDERGWLYRKLPAIAGMSVWTISPSDPRKSGDPCWRLEERTLALVPLQAVGSLPAVPPHEDSRLVKDFVCDNRSGLAIAVGNALRYPRQLLFGPVKSVVALLNHRQARSKQFRLFSLYGEARNRQSRQREELIERGERPRCSRHSR